VRSVARGRRRFSSIAPRSAVPAWAARPARRFPGGGQGGLLRAMKPLLVGDEALSRQVLAALLRKLGGHEVGNWGWRRLL